MRTCTLENCNNKHEAKGYCKRHYKSLIRYGNPIQVDINEEERRLKKIIKENERTRTNQSRDGLCSVIGCIEPIKSRRLCEKHYARMRRNNSLEISRIESGSIDRCLAVGCNRKHKTNGYCETHYKNLRLTGAPHLPKVVKYCGVKGCKGRHQAKGLCMKHYRIWKKNLEQIEGDV